MGAASMVVLNLTVALTISTLVIAEMHRPNAELVMDDSVASWFGEISSSFLLITLEQH
jgi:hypothetical protein